MRSKAEDLKRTDKERENIVIQGIIRRSLTSKMLFRHAYCLFLLATHTKDIIRESAQFKQRTTIVITIVQTVATMQAICHPWPVKTILLIANALHLVFKTLAKCSITR